MSTVKTYRTVEGDVVDLIAFDHYGTSKGTTEAIYDANRGLADHGPILPGGLLITLPVVTAQAQLKTRRVIQLWD